MASARINWLRIVAEGSAIVVSILLAFAIDAGWDRLKEAEEEQRILAGLEREFEGYASRFDYNVERGEEGLMALRQLMLAGPPTFADPPPLGVADTALFFLTSAATSDPSANLEALLSSGRLELLSDPDLREQLASWPATMSDIRDNELSVRDWMNNVVSPFLIERGVPLSRAQRAVQGEWPVPALSDTEASRLYDELLREQSFSTLVSIAYAYRRNQVNESRGAAEAAREILRAIQSSLDASRR